MTAAVNPTSASNDPFSGINGTNTKTKSEADEIQDRFLKLLITQLQTQDPLNPLDNYQMTSQMAQISSVQGIEKLNASVSALTDAYAASQAFAAAGMIGHVSLIEGSHMLLTYADGTEVDADGNKIKVPVAQGGISLPNGADEVTVKVYNSDGELVDSVTMGAQQPGISHFSWDGKGSDGEPLPEGMYSFSVEAKKGGNTASAKPLGFARIDALTWENGSPKLILSTGQKISPSDIRELL